MRILVALLAACLLTGCPEAKYQDASDDERYAGLAGSRYQAKVDLVLHGVSYGRGPNKQVDEYVITERPGFDGPEVISRAALKKGVTIRIKKVLVCTNCLTSKAKFDVEIHPPHSDPTKPFSLVGVDDDLTKSQDGRISLSADLFSSQ